MVLKNLFHRSTPPVEVPDEEPPLGFLSTRAGVSSISDVVPRRPATVIGEITSVRVVPKVGADWLEVTISDGSGKLVAMWTGRREIAGVRPGQRLVLRGRASATGPGGRLLVYNPLYELL